MLVRPIAGQHELGVVYGLEFEAYRRTGFCPPHSSGRLIRHPRFDGIPETSVLVAVRDDQIVGTCSFTRDGPRGLSVDLDFKTTTDEFRREGIRLSDFWRRAIRKDCPVPAKVLMALLRRTFKDARRTGLTLMSVHPDHVKAWEHLLRMKPIAECSAGVDNAPAVLMSIAWGDVPDGWLP